MYEFDNPAIRVGLQYFPIPTYRFEQNVESDNLNALGYTHTTTLRSNEYVVQFDLPQDQGGELHERMEAAHGLHVPEVTLTDLYSTEAISLDAAAVEAKPDDDNDTYRFRIKSPEVTTRQAY